jgi:hypothetical protein
VVVTTASLPGGQVKVLYSQRLAATGGTGSYTWSVAGGSLPTGLNLVADTIKGTPTASGTFNFTVQASSGGSTDTQALSIVVADSVAITTTSLPGGIVKVAYNQHLAATGGTGSFTWSQTAGNLPGGLSLAGDSISGTPTTPGTFNFTVQAASGGGTDTQALSIVVADSVTVTTTTLPSGVATQPYSQRLTATGGTGAYTWSVTSGSLPAGLNLVADTITGTPTTAGISAFTVQASSGGQTDVQDLSLTIAWPPVTITTASPLPDAQRTVPYTPVQLAATGGDGANYTWALATGSALPTALTLSSAGVISGTPDAALTPGNYNFTVEATSGGVTGSKAFVLMVRP